MELYNKDAIVNIEVLDEEIVIPYKIYKKGSWKKKPGWFSKGKKWSENMFDLPFMWDLQSESYLNTIGYIYKDNKLIRLPRIYITFMDKSSKHIYFNSSKERDEYLNYFDLTKYIEIND